MPEEGDVDFLSFQVSGCQQEQQDGNESSDFHASNIFLHLPDHKEGL